MRRSRGADASAGSPIRVMQLVYSLQIGGSEKLALDISSHLDATRFRPSVCALDLDGSLAQELDQRQIPHYVMHRRGVEPAVLRRLYRVIKDNRIDVVHTHHFGQLFYGLLPARLAGARVIHTEHEFFTYDGHRFSQRMVAPLVRGCAAMTVVGPEVADYFIDALGVPRDRITIVRNGVDLDGFDYDCATARRELDLDPADVVIGTIGRLEPEKDQVTLLDVFRAVLARHPRARLMIAGDGQMAGTLKSHAQTIGIADRTLFLGYRRDIARLLSAMDIFVLTSIREGLPISLIEAMAARRPVVASDIGSVKDLVRDGESGFVVPARDARAFVDAIERLMQSSELRARAGRAGRATVEASFSLSTAVRTYETLYQSAVAGTRVRH